MSTKYPGGVISKTAVTPAGPYETSAASGIWTVDQAMQYKKQNLWPIPGNPVLYIEDLFSPFLYDGTATARTITNNINLSTYGGLVWTKLRTSAGSGHVLYDTSRGVQKQLATSSGGGQTTVTQGVTAFGTTGYNIGSTAPLNDNANGIVSWTFRERANFFDSLTYTGTGTSGLVVNHNLGSSPGCIIIKRTDASDSWYVWNRTYTSGQYMFLESTAAIQTSGGLSISVSSTQITINSTFTTVNGNGATYVMYLFAHNAGGFGASGLENGISCGSFSTDSSGNATVSLGYEPQWLWVKRTDGISDWILVDNMRQFSKAYYAGLFPNLNSAESRGAAVYVEPTATGFKWNAGFGAVSASAIYVAIRRGVMRVPTTGTSVFNATAGTASSGTVNTAGFPIDMQISKTATGSASVVIDRLRNATSSTADNSAYLVASGTAVENNTTALSSYWTNTTFRTPLDYNAVSVTYWNFARAPSVFDIVGYTGTGSATTQTHNLTVVPEMIWIKRRASNTSSWAVWSKSFANNNQYLQLNATTAVATDATIFGGAPTSTTFSIATNAATNAANSTYIAYLFASCPGVSQVGFYTGTGSDITVNCGFAAGARFVLIKCISTTGAWFMYDTANGMTSSNAPYYELNALNARVTGTLYVESVSTGFKVKAGSPAALNTSGGQYIYLAYA